jgi:putative hydrolase of the HAD superfamily
MRQMWVVDGDDTLWFVEPLYDDARTVAAEIVGAAGFDAAKWEMLEREIDVANVARYGLDPDRFPKSCVEAYAELAAWSGQLVDKSVSQAVRDAAESVFTRPAPVQHSAARVLMLLRRHGTVILLTKGDDTVQRRRIREADLELAFDGIHIVPDKTEATFLSLLDHYGRPPSEAWSIGNSLRSDINPALRVGMNAIWVDAHVWEYERSETAPVGGNLQIVGSLDDIPGLLARSIPVAQ